MEDANLTAKFAILDRELIENSIRAILDLRAQSNFEAFDVYLAEDVVFEYIGNKDSFIWAGKYRGLQTVKDLYRRINVDIEVLESDVCEVIIEGNHAFSRRRLAVRHRGTGVRISHEIWDIWYFRNGKIIESKKLVDTKAFENLQS